MENLHYVKKKIKNKKKKNTLEHQSSIEIEREIEYNGHLDENIIIMNSIECNLIDVCYYLRRATQCRMYRDPKRGNKFGRRLFYWYRE